MLNVHELIGFLRGDIETRNAELPEKYRVEFYLQRDSLKNYEPAVVSDTVKAGFLENGDFAFAKDGSEPDEKTAKQIVEAYKVVRAYNILVEFNELLPTKYGVELEHVDYDQETYELGLYVKLPVIAGEGDMPTHLADMLMDIDCVHILPMPGRQLAISVTVNRNLNDILIPIGEWIQKYEEEFSGHIITNPLAYKRLLQIQKKAVELFGQAELRKPDIFDERGDVISVVQHITLAKLGGSDFADLLDMVDGFSFFPRRNNRIEIALSVNDVYIIVRDSDK